MKISTICLALYLILVGVFALTNITFVFASAILGILAIIAGILMLVGR